MSHQERIELAHKTADEFRKHIKADKIILFGSLPIEKDNELSDIDILLVAHGDAPDGDLTSRQIDEFTQICLNLDSEQFPMLFRRNNFIHVCFSSSQHFEKPPLRQFMQIRKIKKHGREL